MGDYFLRRSTCNQCSHGRPVGGDYKIAYCEKTKRKGWASRACYCQKFERRFQTSSNQVSDLGFKYRSKQVEDYRTRRQWEEIGYIVKEGEKGHEMHASMMSNKTFVYYLPEEVEPMTGKEECCATCDIREGRFCVVAGDYVSSSHHCSEWSPKPDEE